MSTSSFRPLRDHVLLRALPRDEKTAGGLYIPDSAGQKQDRAEVLACGPGRVTDRGHLVEPRVKTGDQVIFARHQRTEVPIEVDGEELLVVPEAAILGVLDD